MHSLEGIPLETAAGDQLGMMRRVFLDDYTGWPSFATINLGTDPSRGRMAILTTQEEDDLFDYYGVPIDGISRRSPTLVTHSCPATTAMCPSYPKTKPDVVTRKAATSRVNGSYLSSPGSSSSVATGPSRPVPGCDPVQAVSSVEPADATKVGTTSRVVPLLHSPAR